MNEINELVFILDMSGSMHSLRKDVIGGFNSILESQKKIEGETYVTVVLFNNRVHTLVDRVNLKDVKAISEEDYLPGGSTALYDAIGSSVRHIQKVHTYIRKEDIPSKITCFITTDGYENASVKYNVRQIKNLIKELSDDGKWEFNFLAQGIDSDSYREDLGLNADCCFDFDVDEEGTTKNFACMNARATLRRQGGR